MAGRDAAAAALDQDLSGARVVIDPDAERFESLDHDPRVLAVQSAGQRAGAIGHRRNCKGAIGEALRARDANR